jgi:hypothetical protein
LQVEDVFLGIEKWPTLATDAEAIVHWLIACHRYEGEVIPALMVIEITILIRIEVIQPVYSTRITGPYSQDHRFLVDVLRDGKGNISCIANEREHGFRLWENNVLWGEIGKHGYATKEIKIQSTAMGKKEYFAV